MCYGESKSFETQYYCYAIQIAGGTGNSTAIISFVSVM